VSQAKIDTTVPTYHSDGRGHTEPNVPVQIGVGQGVTLTLGPERPNGQPDVYVERRPNGWSINITPDAADIRVAVTVADDGTITATDAHGTVILHEPPTPVEVPTPPRQVSLERKMQIFQDLKKTFRYSKDTGKWHWIDPYNRNVTGTESGPFDTFEAMLLDAVDPYIEESDDGK
jgi:hypothetical protein